MNSSQLEFVSYYSDLFQGFGYCKSVSDFIACQFALESDFGKSDIAKFNLNFCGMKHPALRPTFSVCQKRGFALYYGCRDSVYDYLLWLSWHRFTVQMDLDEFRTRLKAKGYCPESDYITKINYLLKSYQDGQKL